MRLGQVNDVSKQQGLMGQQEHDLIMAEEEFSGKTVKNPSSRACWTKRLGQVSKYHLKVQKMQKQRIRKIPSQWHLKSAKAILWHGCQKRDRFTLKEKFSVLGQPTTPVRPDLQCWIQGVIKMSNVVVFEVPKMVWTPGPDLLVWWLWPGLI